jgi:hypothetical protein
MSPTAREPLEPNAAGPGLALLALATLVLVEVAEQSSNFFTSHPYVRATVLGVVLLGLAGIWLRQARARVLGHVAPSWSPRAERAASIGLALLPAASIAWAVQNRGPGVFVVPAWIPLAIVAGWIGACLAVVPRIPVAIPIGAALLAGLGLRAFDFIAVPVDARRADMIPLVGAAVARLLEGHDPYVLYGMPWPLPLTYMPLTWLAFVPAVLARIDLRWTSAVCELGLLALLWRRSGRANRPFLLLYAAWFGSTVMPYTDAITAMPVQSCAIAAAALLVATRSRAAPAALGAAAATTPLVGALVPLVAVAWWREGGGRLVAKRASVAALVFAVLVVPWVIGNPRGFWVGPVRWFNNIDGFPRRTWNQSHAWAWVPGLTGVFWTLGLERLLRPVQLALVAAVALLVVRSTRGGRVVDGVAWLQAALATMVAFVAVNVIVWPYHYEPAAVLALATVGADCAARGGWGPTGLPRR